MMKPEYLGMYTAKLSARYNIDLMAVYDSMVVEEKKIRDKYFDPSKPLFEKSYYLNAAGVLSKEYKDLELLINTHAW